MCRKRDAILLRDYLYDKNGDSTYEGDARYKKKETRKDTPKIIDKQRKWNQDNNPGFSIWL